MKYSLLFRNGTKTKPISSVYDLNLDKSFKRISGENKRTAFFLRTVEKPLANIDNIEYRREIISDLYNNTGLLETLRTVFSRYDKVKADWLEMKSGANTATIEVSENVRLEQIIASLKVTAMFPGTLLSMYRSISEILEKADISSRAFCEILGFCNEMINSDEFHSLMDATSVFLYKTADECSYDIICRFDEKLKVADCSLIGVGEYRKKRRLLGITSKKYYDERHPYELIEGAEDEAKLLLCRALSEVDTLLETMTGKIYESLYGISYELDFFSVALEYVSFLHNSGYPYCYPKITETSCVRVEGLRDLFLMTDEQTETVFPYRVNIDYPHTAMVVTGSNGSGKTTFLRAIGTVQILTQAGLPVPCEEAEISLRSGIFSHFSKEEESFSYNDNAGRFESEVRAIADIIENAESNSLILLNETFQTTSYDEGSEAITHILGAFDKIGAQYIFITHLPNVASSLSKNVMKMKTGNTFGELIEQ